MPIRSKDSAAQMIKKTLTGEVHKSKYVVQSSQSIMVKQDHGEKCLLVRSS